MVIRGQIIVTIRKVLLSFVEEFEVMLGMLYIGRMTSVCVESQNGAYRNGTWDLVLTALPRPGFLATYVNITE